LPKISLDGFTCWSNGTLSSTFGRVTRAQSIRLWNLQLQRQRCIRLEHIFTKDKNHFCLQKALGYSWRYRFLQRWRCHSRS
jgi:hypothetical protein